MSLSKECYTYHLTPRGWVEGTFEADTLGSSRIKGTPKDRVLTICCYDEQTSLHSKSFFYDKTVWESDDPNMVKKLTKKYGKKPNWFGYKEMK